MDREKTLNTVCEACCQKTDHLKYMRLDPEFAQVHRTISFAYGDR